MADITLMKIKTGELLICHLETDDEQTISVTHPMEFREVSYQDLHGMTLFPLVPMDEGELITFYKEDVLFFCPPHQMLIALYLSKIQETLALNDSYTQSYHAAQTEKKKYLN